MTNANEQIQLIMDAGMPARNLRTAIELVMCDAEKAYNPNHPDYAGSDFAETQRNIAFIMNSDMDFNDRYDFTIYNDAVDAVNEWFDQTESEVDGYFMDM